MYRFDLPACTYFESVAFIPWVVGVWNFHPPTYWPTSPVEFCIRQIFYSSRLRDFFSTNLELFPQIGGGERGPQS